MAEIIFMTGPGSTIPLEDDAQLADLVFRLREGFVRKIPVTFNLGSGESAQEDHLFVPPGTAFIARFDNGYPAELEDRIGKMLDNH